MKQPSENMQKMYAAKRERTLSLIQDAIDEIKEDNRIVTKKELMSLTGLSSGTFSQEHVKELLRKNEVCQFRKVARAASSTDGLGSKDEQIARLAKENQKLQSRLEDLEISLEANSKRASKLAGEKRDLERKYQLLLGKYQQQLEYLEVLGCDLSGMPLV